MNLGTLAVTWFWVVNFVWDGHALRDIQRPWPMDKKIPVAAPIYSNHTLGGLLPLG